MGWAKGNGALVDRPGVNCDGNHWPDPSRPRVVRIKRGHVIDAIRYLAAQAVAALRERNAVMDTSTARWLAKHYEFKAYAHAAWYVGRSILRKFPFWP